MSQPSIDQNEINRLRDLLATYRRNLEYLLQQAAKSGGEIFAPLVVYNEIFEARRNIQQLKATLHDYGVVVDDQLGDEPAEDSGVQSPHSSYANAPTPGESPFKGLLFFDEADAGMFFGREALTAKLVAHLREQRLLIVVGASGSGKSSVIRAGLIPALRRNQPLDDGSLPPSGSAQWLIHVITPTTHPLEALAASLTYDVESVTATATLIDDLAHDPRSLHLAVRRRLSRVAPGAGEHLRLVVIVDQFEEVFTLCKDAAERKAFVDNVLTATGPDLQGPTVVVIAVRADFYDECGQFVQLRIALEQQQVYIGSMSTDELRRAIEEPARRGGWEFEPGLVNMMLGEVGAEPGVLPLLSHALRETWKRRSGRLLTLQGYSEAGGIRRAIAKTAETVFKEQLTLEQQVVARNVFVRLTQLGEGTQDTRRRVMLEELIPHPEHAVLIASVLRILADARLITTEHAAVEVAHEALIREWPLLRKWLNDDREGLRLQSQIAEAAREWQNLNNDESILYRGTRLTIVDEWSQAHPDSLVPREQEFLNASRALRQQEQDAVELRRQKELDDTRKLAQEAEARVVAERRVTRRTRWLLAVTVLLTLVLVDNVRRLRSELELARQQAQHQVIIPVTGGLISIKSGDQIKQIQVVTFSMEQNEVTNRQYRLCVQVGICSLPLDITRYENFAFEQYPIVNVTAVQAATYCAWLDRRLPTTSEWELAARGSEGRLWPWGNAAPSPLLANYDIGGISGLQPVGSHPAGATPDGIMDLAGNAAEWTASVCESGDCSGIWNGVNPATSAIRGGSWQTLPDSDISNIVVASSDIYSSDLGFRCVQSQ